MGNITTQIRGLQELKSDSYDLGWNDGEQGRKWRESIKTLSASNVHYSEYNQGYDDGKASRDQTLARNNSNS